MSMDSQTTQLLEEDANNINRTEILDRKLDSEISHGMKMVELS